MRNQIKIAGSAAFRGKPLLFKSIYAVGTALMLMTFGCQKTNFSDMETSDSAMDMRLHHSDCNQINLVGSTDEYAPVFVDAQLVNAWGLAFDDEGEIWVSAAESGVSKIYNAMGMEEMPAVTIPGVDGESGEPTGVVYNESAGAFNLPDGSHSEFIFATENGTIAAWSSGPSAVTVVDRSGIGAVYKGITIGRSMTGEYFLYATDFHNGHVDVFDENFNYMPDAQFIDATLPLGFAPFNIKFIDTYLYVTYAKQLGPDNVDDEKGPGNGYINRFNVDGTFIDRFASEGSLNSPWGIAKKPGAEQAILVGNFGSGRITVFSAIGKQKSYLQTDEFPVDIPGLWAIEFPKGNLEGDANQRLYFTAGPDHEEEGLFGYLDPVFE